MSVSSDRERIEKLARSIVEAAADVAAATARWLALVAEFDREEAYLEWECHSTAHWLIWKCGMAESTARQHVLVARALEELPHIAGAFARGEVSYCKVRALVRMATPDTEAELLELARVCTGTQLAKIARAYRRATRDPERPRPPRVEVDWDDDGDMVLTAKLPADVGLQFLRAMHVAATVAAGESEELTEAGRGDVDEKARQRRVGKVVAFGTMVELALAGAGDAAASPPPPELVVTVSADELRSLADEDGAREPAGDAGDEPLPGRRGLTRHMARRLACDATTATLVHDGRGSPLDLGRRSRTANPALRMALHQRSGGTCEFPGCSHRRFLHAHHIEHWADGGPTTLSNLVNLCSWHHRLLHEGRYRVRVGADGRLRFVRADGTELEPGPLPPQAAGERIVEPASGSIEPLWAGEHLDLSCAIDGILSLERIAARRRDAAASRGCPTAA